MKKLVAISLFLLAGTIGFGQTAHLSNDDVEYSVYKEYDKDGNLLRYDSSRVEKRPGFHQKFHFNFNTDSLPFVKFKVNSLLMGKKNFLFKKRDFLDSLISNKYAPEFRILRLDSMFESMAPQDFHFEFDASKKRIDSILNQHFNRMENLFEKYFEKEEPISNKKTAS